MSAQKSKELSYYSIEYSKGFEYYSQLFYGDMNQLRYDNSPIYFDDYDVPERISNT